MQYNGLQVGTWYTSRYRCQSFKVVSDGQRITIYSMREQLMPLAVWSPRRLFILEQHSDSETPHVEILFSEETQDKTYIHIHQFVDRWTSLEPIVQFVWSKDRRSCAIDCLGAYYLPERKVIIRNPTAEDIDRGIYESYLRQSELGRVQRVGPKSYTRPLDCATSMDPNSDEFKSAIGEDRGATYYLINPGGDLMTQNGQPVLLTREYYLSVAGPIHNRYSYCPLHRRTIYY